MYEASSAETSAATPHGKGTLDPIPDSRYSRDPTATGRVARSGLCMALGSTRRFAFLTGGRVSRADIASRATEALDVALFERETYEPG
jgi:hypothetical protein